jgi:PleD family two-component response regulator
MNKTRGLIVDNNCDMANFLEIVLGLAGLECEIAYSPQAALDYLASNEPDLVFLDLDKRLADQMMDLLSYIRSNPRFDSTRVIVLAGYPALDHPVGSLADLVLANPVESEHLSRLTSRLLMMEVKPHEFRDPVTGLYNLKFFNTRLELAFERSKRRTDFIFALQAVELIAPEEAALSEDEWEQVLKIVVKRWLAKFRPTNVFARRARRQVLGLFEDLKAPDDAQVIVQRLLDELALPVELNGNRVTLTACTAGVINTNGYPSAQAILDGALVALESELPGGPAGLE